MQTIDRVARRESPGDVPQVQRYRPFDRVAAISLVDAVRRAMPGATAVQGLRAVRTLATLRNHPERAEAFARYLDIPTDGTMARFTPAPEPYQARRHEQNASGEVKRYGLARVQGRADCIDDTPSGFSPALLNQMLRDLPRNAVGACELDVTALTDLFYGADQEFPELLGSHVKAFRQVVHASPEVDPWSAQGSFDGRGAAMGKLKPWRDRRGIDMPTARLSDPAACIVVRVKRNKQGRKVRRATFVPVRDFVAGADVVRRTRYVAPCDRGTIRAEVTRAETIALKPRVVGRWNAALTRWDLVELLPARTVTRETRRDAVKSAPATRLFIGHDCHQRGVTAHQARGGKRRARLVATVAASSLVAFRDAVANLNRGDAATITLRGTAFTVTRGKGDAGTFALKPPTGRTIGGLRTPGNVAERADRAIA